METLDCTYAPMLAAHAASAASSYPTLWMIQLLRLFRRFDSCQLLSIRRRTVLTSRMRPESVLASPEERLMSVLLSLLPFVRKTVSSCCAALAGLALLCLPGWLAAQEITVDSSTTSVNIGTVNVCRPGATAPAPCSTTVDLIYKGGGSGYGRAKVSDLGIADVNFHYVPSDTSCSDPYFDQPHATTSLAPSSLEPGDCRIRVRFTPTHTGGFKGAVQLVGEYSKIVRTTFIYGFGKGPQLKFDPNSPTVPQTRLYTPSVVGGIGGAVLNSRNELLLADPDGRQLVLITTRNTGGYPTTLNYEPYSPVLDGGGTVYLIDKAGKRVVEYPPNLRPSITLPFQFSGTPNGLAVDGQGVLYVTQTGSSVVLKLPFGATTQQVINTAVIDTTEAQGVQADAAGNVFVSKASGALVEAPAGGAALRLVTRAFHPEYPYFALDGIDDALNPQRAAADVLQVPPSGKQITALSLGPFPDYPFPLRAYAPVATAVDGTGNLYVSDIQNTVPQTLLFRRDISAPVNVGIVPVGSTGQGSLRIFNGGNAPLVVKPVFNNASYAVASTAPANCLSSLASGQSCILNITYTNTGSPDQPPTLTLKTNGLSDPVVSLTANADPVAMPLLSVPTGAYGEPKIVSIYAPTPGSRVFYTTDGTLPTTSSTPYTGPITVSSSETLEAIAVAGTNRSQLALGVYTIANTSEAIDISQGFDYQCEPNPRGDRYSCGGSARLIGNRFRLTDNHPYQAAIVLGDRAASISGFTTDFTFQLSDAMADGFTFLMQVTDPNTDGPQPGHTGKGLGYEGLTGSVALKFDLYSNAGEGNNSVGVYTGGVLPTTPAVDLTGTGIDLHSGHVMLARVSYDTANLNLTLTDTATLSTWSHAFPLDLQKLTTNEFQNYVIPGFTAGTGALTAVQDLLNWTYISAPVVAMPLPVPTVPALPFFPNAINPQGLRLNGAAAVPGAVLQLTDGKTYEAGSAYYAKPVPIGSFTTDFTLQLKSPVADGLTFIVQNAPAGAGALGGKGLLLGSAGIPKSVALKFDLYNNAGEGTDSTGLYLNGASPTSSAINLAGSGVDLHSAHPINAHLNYDGSGLTVTLTDALTRQAWTHTFSVDIPATVGGQTAYIGFTGGTGSKAVVGQILNWTFSNP